MKKKIAFIEVAIGELNKRIIRLINDPKQITTVFDDLPVGMELMKAGGYKCSLAINSQEHQLQFKSKYRFNPENDDPVLFALDNFCSQLKQAQKVLELNDEKLMEFLSINPCERRAWVGQNLLVDDTVLSDPSSGHISILQFLETLKLLRSLYLPKELDPSPLKLVSQFTTETPSA